MNSRKTTYVMLIASGPNGEEFKEFEKTSDGTIDDIIEAIDAKKLTGFYGAYPFRREDEMDTINNILTSFIKSYSLPVWVVSAPVYRRLHENYVKYKRDKIRNENNEIRSDE